MAVRLKDRIEANIRQSDKVNSSLSIQLNSGTATVYDGSSAKTINVTPAAINAVNKSGDTMTGVLNAHGGITLNNKTESSTALEYILGIKAFASGGNVIWSQKDNVSVGHATNATQLATAGTTAQFYRGDRIWSNTLKTTSNELLGIDASTLIIGTSTRILHIDCGNGSGSGVNDGFATGITFGSGNVAYGGIYYQSSGSYGSRLIFATTNLYVDGSKARMIITSDGKVGIGTLTPSYKLSVNGDISATNFRGALIGNASSATKLQTARSIFGQSFNGTANVAGKPLVYGTYTSTANQRYANSGIEVRENGLVGSAQSDIGYAPAIGFHWSGRIAATLLFHNDGKFYFRKQDGVTRATVDCIAAVASTLSGYPHTNFVHSDTLDRASVDALNQPNGTGYYARISDGSGILGVEWGKNTDGKNFGMQLQQSGWDGTLTVRSFNGWGASWTAWKKVWCEGQSVTGAVWNDYAEYRESNCQEFGRVLVENGDDSLSISNFRLQPFAGVSSDTWGFCQGETEKAKTPIAVAGRVLVYPYQNRKNYKPGDCVCAAPNGTVDIMTRQEVIQYPDRIVGTVSCIPDYEEWGQGDRPAVKVDGRIWIKVR